MSRTALRCSSPRSVGASRNPDQYSSSGSQSNGSMTPVILGWPLINGSPGRNITIRRERKRHRGWERWDLSWTGEAVSPSCMVFCYISSSSVPWWILRVPSAGPPLAPISRNCRCCSSSVFALLPMHPGILVTDKFTMIWESPTSPTVSDLWEIRLEVSWCGEPLSWAARRTSTQIERRPVSPKTGKSRSTTCPGYPKGGHADTLNRANWHFSATLTEVFPAFSSILRQMPGYNSQRRGTARTLSKLGDIFTQLVNR